jgi:hypothetical protein
MLSDPVILKKIINKALKTLKCPVCQSSRFVANHNITIKVPIDRRNNQCEGTICPSLEFTCLECGNILSLNAEVLAKQIAHL